MKISIITVVLNAEEFLEQCIRSVISQTHPEIEYIIIDGGSSDSSLAIIQQYSDKVSVVVSEKDNGIYDAMNKGISLATGEVIGILNADDFFADDRVIADIAAAFSGDTDIVYGDLWYVGRRDPAKAIRKWISGPYSDLAIQWGWMPAHPTFYARRSLFSKLGNYNLKFKSVSDYEIMLRFLYLNKSKSIYLNRVFVKMRVGGISNRSLSNRLQASLNDMKAMRSNKITLPWLKILIKPLRKVNQYFN